MRNRCKSVLGLWAIGLWLGVGAPAQAATGVGPYYATPSWDQSLPAATRFIVLTNMGSQAVLDRETGLVWDQKPDTSVQNWLNAHEHCNRRLRGDRRGWRLPTLQELLSLIDPTVAGVPKLPTGHPFVNVQLDFYWSATTSAADTGFAWAVLFSSGNILTAGKGTGRLAWCVRGGQGVDPQ